MPEQRKHKKKPCVYIESIMSPYRLYLSFFFSFIVTRIHINKSNAKQLKSHIHSITKNKSNYRERCYHPDFNLANLEYTSFNIIVLNIAVYIVNLPPVNTIFPLSFIFLVLMFFVYLSSSRYDPI